MGVTYVKHGGHIRYSAVVSSSESTNWNRGLVLMIDTAGQFQVFDGASAYPLGLATEDRVTSNTGPTTTVTKTGAPTGDRYSVILDDAVYVNDQLRSGIVFAAADKLYVDTAGKITTSGNGTGSYSPLVGFALGYGHAGDSARPLEMYWHVEY